MAMSNASFADTDSTPNAIWQGICPSCQQPTTFTIVGVQRWSAAIARKNDMPQAQVLFNCDACGSAISEASLH